jgi:hypothetical protein
MKTERYHDHRVTYSLISHVICHKAVSRLASRLPSRITVSRRQWMLEPDSEPEAEELLPWMMEAQIVFPAGSPVVSILLWLGGGEADAYWKVKGRYGAWGAVSGFESLTEAEDALEELHHVLEEVVNKFCASVPEDKPLYPPFIVDEPPE